MGTSSPSNELIFTLKDHPHACGDKPIALATFSTSVGSSPRVWGQEIYDKLTEMRARIIPTRVGTSQHRQSNAVTGKDHPHACGDKAEASEPARQELGSSPRVWGQDHFPPALCAVVRIIPTRVGTRSVFLFAHSRR